MVKKTAPFIYFYLFSEAIQLFLSKNLGLSESPISSQFLSLLIEMSSLIETKELHVLNVAENTHVKTHQDIVITVAF